MSKTENVFVDKTVLDPNKKFVNGPINVARLEGEVNGIRKVIYLFMDNHSDLSQQTECSNIYAQHINTYLLNIFTKLKNSDKIIDVFLEEDLEFALNKGAISGKWRYDIKGIQRSDIYLLEVLLMFKKMFNFSPEANKVFKTPLFDNMRIHYIDPRNMFAYPNGLYMLSLELMNLLTQDIYDVVGFRASQTKRYIIGYKNQWKHFQKIISECLNKVNVCDVKSNVFGGVTTIDNYDTYLKHIFHKMTYRYNHKNIQKILVSYLTTESEKLHKIISYLDKLHDMFEKLNNDYREKYNSTNEPSFSIKHQYYYYPYFIENASEIYEKPLVDLANKIFGLIKSGGIYMDLFFLRRFLDKDYITNVIAYTGALHSANYIQILMQEFGFKITHIATSNGLSITELNNKIKKANHIEEIQYMINPKVLQQCSDLTNFPENFE